MNRDIFFKTAVIIFLIINIILLARILGDIYLPGEISTLQKARQGAQTVISYSEDLATSYGVDEHKHVRDILAKFKYEIEKADSSEEVASLMVDYGRQVQDAIFRELQNKRINKILNVVNSQELPETGNITISHIEGKLKFVDPGSILTEATRSNLKDLPFNQTIDLKIEQKKAHLLPTGELFNQVDFLQTKVASLERQLKLIKQKAGYETLTGDGIIIQVFDNENQNMKNGEEIGIVHDSDIRKIINELLIAGARGVEVGGQRLTAVSPVRCVGPTLHVNNIPISVNPVVIKAIGKPEVLKSSLDIMKKQLATFGIKLKISIENDITLNKQS